MKYKPIKDKVLIKPMKAEEKTASGIIIPEMAQEKPNRGTVTSIGSTVISLQEGDIVLYGKFGGSEIKLDNESYLIIKEEDILLIEK
jgi:chaperonin GroES